MSDLATTTHNVPPAAVAQILRGRYQWAAYQTLAAAAGEWIEADDLRVAVYGDDCNSWEPGKALKGVLSRMRQKGIPVQTYYSPGNWLRYRLPLEWQRQQDGVAS